MNDLEIIIKKSSNDQENDKIFIIGNHETMKNTFNDCLNAIKSGKNFETMAFTNNKKMIDIVFTETKENYVNGNINYNYIIAGLIISISIVTVFIAFLLNR